MHLALGHLGSGNRLGSAVEYPDLLETGGQRLCVFEHYLAAERVADQHVGPDVEVHRKPVEILCAGGGPTIWVDTFREQVTGWWGTDRVQWYYQDNMGLNDYMEEMYGC